MAIKSPPAEMRIGVASGRLGWTPDGDDLVSGAYRIRPIGPGRWETTRKGRVIHVDRRRSMALANAEHHHRERQRTLQIIGWGLAAAAALVVGAVASRWIDSPVGYLLLAGAVWALLGSLARCVASMTRSLIDPYRTRESWEPPDWWNH